MEAAGAGSASGDSAGRYAGEQAEAGAAAQAAPSAGEWRTPAELRESALALLGSAEIYTGAPPARRINLRDEVRRFEAELIRRALAHTGGHQRRAARLLGIKTTTLHAKIKRYRLGSYAAPPEETATEAPRPEAGVVLDS